MCVLQVLWVNDNSFSRITNLDFNPTIKSLYAHNNRIRSLKVQQQAYRTSVDLFPFPLPSVCVGRGQSTISRPPADTALQQQKFPTARAIHCVTTSRLGPAEEGPVQRNYRPRTPQRLPGQMQLVFQGTTCTAVLAQVYQGKNNFLAREGGGKLHRAVARL